MVRSDYNEDISKKESVMETTYLNPLNNWKRESIPAEIITLAESRVAWLNSSDNGYKRGIKTLLKSVQVGSEKLELQPNPKNIDTANTVKIREWSYTVEVITKIFKNGKVKSYDTTYFLYRELLEVEEVGGYKNPNN